MMPRIPRKRRDRAVGMKKLWHATRWHEKRRQTSNARARTITAYFNQGGVPAPSSAVGMLIQKIHAEFPDLDFETIRAEAREALDGMVGANRIAQAYQRWRANSMRFTQIWRQTN